MTDDEIAGIALDYYDIIMTMEICVLMAVKHRVNPKKALPRCARQLLARIEYGDLRDILASIARSDNPVQSLARQRFIFDNALTPVDD